MSFLPSTLGTLPKDGGRNKKAFTSSEKKAHATRGRWPCSVAPLSGDISGDTIYITASISPSRCCCFCLSSPPRFTLGSLPKEGWTQQKSLHLLREGTQATRGAPAPSRRCSGDITGISPPRCYTVFCLSSPPHFGTLPKDGGRNKKAVTSSEKKAHATRGGPAPSRRSRVISPGALVISPAYHRRWLRHSQVKAPAGGVGTFRPHPRAQ